MSRMQILTVLLCLGGATALAASCENLTSLTIPGTAIASATAVPAGPFSPVRGRQRRRRATSVSGVLSRRGRRETGGGFRDSHRDMAARKQRLERQTPGHGERRLFRRIGYADMERGLRSGYAVAGSDTGHEGGDLKFGVGHPEKINDWAWRAVHVMTETAKLVIRSYYGRFAAHAYFSGCSTGGQQALTEAQRYPGDYDGILAGDPGNNRVRLNIGFLWSWLAANGDARRRFPLPNWR